jgi:hypothetical protein
MQQSTRRGVDGGARAALGDRLQQDARGHHLPAPAQRESVSMLACHSSFPLPTSISTPHPLHHHQSHRPTDRPWLSSSLPSPLFLHADHAGHPHLEPDRVRVRALRAAWVEVRPGLRHPPRAPPGACVRACVGCVCVLYMNVCAWRLPHDGTGVTDRSLGWIA